MKCSAVVSFTYDGSFTGGTWQLLLLLLLLFSSLHVNSFEIGLSQ